MQPVACDVCGRRHETPAGATAACASCGAAIAASAVVAPTARPIEDYTTRPAGALPVAVAAPARAARGEGFADTDTRTAAPPAYDTTRTLPADPSFAPLAGPASPGGPPDGTTLDASTRPVADAPISATTTTTGGMGGAPGRAGGMSRTRLASMAALVVVLLGVVAGIALVGSGGLPSLGLGPARPTGTPGRPAATATPSPPAGFTHYQDAAAGYALDVPQGWQHQANPGAKIGSTTFYDDATTLLAVWTIDGGAAVSGGPLDDTYLGVYGGNDPLANKQGPVDVTVGGATWARESADGTAPNGDAVHLVVLNTIREVGQGTASHKRTYIVVYGAPAANFPGDDDAYFQQMLASFAFLG